MTQSWRVYLMGALALLGIQAVVLYGFGQPPICTCGYVKL